MHHRFGRHPQETGFSIIFAAPKLHERDATEPNIRPNVYRADALPSESSRIIRGQPEQTVAWPKHGDASYSHGTHHTEPISMRGISRCNPVDLLHVTGPSQCPRADEPHTASIARVRPAVAGSARKGIAHAVRNSASVSDRYDWNFAQDTLNGDDIQDRFLVVKLVYHPGSNRLQPSYNTTVRNNCNNCNNTHQSNKSVILQ
jgi:hypothetical protein